MEVNLKNKCAEIKIPASKILSHEIYEDSLKVFNERESILIEFTSEIKTTFLKTKRKKWK